MTRRKFVGKLLKAGAAVVLGTWQVATKAAPRKFVWAVRADKYPGRLQRLPSIYKQSKWSG